MQKVRQCYRKKNSSKNNIRKFFQKNLKKLLKLQCSTKTFLMEKFFFWNSAHFANFVSLMLTEWNPRWPPNYTRNVSIHACAWWIELDKITCVKGRHCSPWVRMRDDRMLFFLWINKLLWWVTLNYVLSSESREREFKFRYTYWQKVGPWRWTINWEKVYKYGLELGWKSI